MAQPAYVQGTLDTLLSADGSVDPAALSLKDTTFVVLDLETTGGAPDGGGITEIGAVKVCAGVEQGVFATLVNPGERLPPFITVLTGITEAVLPSLLEFLRGSVLVAHNAPYDVGFLKAACNRHGYPWPQLRVLDTAAVARRALTRDEVPNRKLATLAQFFRAAVQPTHRALDDAKATVDVLHGLIERLGSYRVHTLGDAIEFAKAVTPTQRRQRHLADGLPHVPGVYVFRGADERPLYVGTSKDIGTRVRSYFTASEKRARISEMLAAAVRIEAVECAHSLEAEVRELRLIAAHSPPYNRRSKYPDRVVWLKLTAEAYPRLSVVRALADDDAAYLGPFSSRRTAELAAAGVYDAVPLRQCTHKLSTRTQTPACALAELGKCPAPCEHKISTEDYTARAALPFRTATYGDPRPLVDALMGRIEFLSDRRRYEEAAVIRSRLIALLRATVRMQRLGALTRISELVAARRDKIGGWEIVVVRHGRLAAAATSPPRLHPRPTLDMARATAETVRPGPGPVPAATAEETERILAWLEHADTRLVETSGDWVSPARGAARFTGLLTRAEAAASGRDSSVRSSVTDRSDDARSLRL